MIEEWESLVFPGTITTAIENNGVYSEFDTWEKIDLSTHMSSGRSYFEFTDEKGNHHETTILWSMPIILLWTKDAYIRNRDHAIRVAEGAYLEWHNLNSRPGVR